MGSSSSSKAEIFDQLLQGLCALKIKQAAIKTVSDVDSIAINKIFCGLFEHHVEEDREESWY